MNVEQRVLTCRVLEKMKEQKEYGRKLGLKDVSAMHGRRIYQRSVEIEEKG